MQRLINGLVAAVCAVALLFAGYTLYDTIGKTMMTQTLGEHDISLEQAIAAAQGAIDECKKTESNISVVVVDRVGSLRFAIRGTGATAQDLDAARRKAYTARTFRRTSASWAELSAPDKPLAGQRKLADTNPEAGGVPVIFYGDGIGGIGVTGSKGGPANDEDCAKAGLAKIANQLL